MKVLLKMEMNINSIKEISKDENAEVLVIATAIEAEIADLTVLKSSFYF